MAAIEARGIQKNVSGKWGIAMKILNFGSLNIDYVYKVDHIVQRGETQHSISRSVFSGGKGLNQSVALAKAGLQVYHAGCIGAGGEFLLDVLHESGVDTSLVKVLQDTPSGHTVIQNSKDGDNCILLFGGANQCITEEFCDEVLSNFYAGDYLVLQNEISSIPHLIKKAHERGMQIVLNPSPMTEEIKTWPLECIDYFFVNEIEASQLTGEASDDEDALVSGLRKTFPNAHVVLTMGKNGSCYLYGDTKLHQDAVRVKAVDTTAAGDTFSGFFLSGILSGRTPGEALELAAKAAAIAVTRPGAAPSIPTLEEIEGIR